MAKSKQSKPKQVVISELPHIRPDAEPWEMSPYFQGPGGKKRWQEFLRATFLNNSGAVRRQERAQREEAFWKAVAECHAAQAAYYASL